MRRRRLRQSRRLEPRRTDAVRSMPYTSAPRTGGARLPPPRSLELDCRSPSGGDTNWVRRDVADQPPQLGIERKRVTTDVEIPPAELAPIVYRGDPTPGHGMLGAILVVLVAFDLKDERAAIPQANQEIGL